MSFRELTLCVVRPIAPRDHTFVHVSYGAELIACVTTAVAAGRRCPAKDRECDVASLIVRNRYVVELGMSVTAVQVVEVGRWQRAKQRGM